MPDRREQTTRRILDGAAAAFAKGGYAATSMEEIAAAANVSKLLLYRDFAGKRELYQAVLERTIAGIHEHVPDEASNAALRNLIAAARADPDGFTLLFRHAAREPEFAHIAAGWHETSVRLAERQLQAIEPDRLMRRWVAETVVSTTYVGIMAWLEHGDPARDDEFYRRMLTINRSVAKFPGGKRAR
jgi:AcrR family transcriptional regulator